MADLSKNTKVDEITEVASMADAGASDMTSGINEPSNSTGACNPVVDNLQETTVDNQTVVVNMLTEPVLDPPADTGQQPLTSNVSSSGSGSGIPQPPSRSNNGATPETSDEEIIPSKLLAQPVIDSSDELVRVSDRTTGEGQLLVDSPGIKDAPGAISTRAKRSRQTSVLAPSRQLTVSWADVNVVASGTQRNGASWLQRLTSCGKVEPSEGTPSGSKRPKQILRDVTGIARPGEVLAIMGASGAGKTTLLNVLTDRVKGLVVDGAAFLNGKAVGSAIRSMSAFVQQQDLFIRTLTVKEHLIFQALMRMDKKCSYKDRLARVDLVISELGLSKCQDSIIGGGMPLRTSISGGEKKRLSFASEILTNPPILFCDEPTSGLDSFMAQQVVSVLKLMASHGRTIVVTVHQPSSAVFMMFDSLCLLAEGRVAYLGETKMAEPFFKSVGYPCPGNFNPADHYIRTLAIVPGKEKSCYSRVKKVCRSFAKTKQGDSLQQEIRKYHSPADTSYADDYEWDELLSVQSTYKAGWFAQFRALMWRTQKANSREPFVTTVRLFQTIIISILIGLIFLKTKISSTTIQNVNGIMFSFVTNASFSYVFPSVLIFCSELPVFLREHRSRMYRTDTYFWAKTLTEFPLLILFPTIFATILYWMADIRSDPKVYLVTVLVTILIANLGASLGYLVSAIGGDLTTATAMTPIVVIPFMLFGGFFINYASVPVFFRWLRDCSYIRYGYEALTINIWNGVDSIPGCVGINSTCPHNGAEVLAGLSMNPDNLWRDVGIIFAMLAIYRLLAFLILLIRASAKGG